MLSITRSLLSNLRLTPVTATVTSAATQQLHTSASLERARKGTRERKRKVMLANKKKREERLRKNPPPLPKVLVKMLYERYGIVNGKPWPMRAQEDDKQFPSDDTYRMWTHCYARYPFERALSELRCHYHPSMLNRPDDPVFARVELNMKGVKTVRKTEFSKLAFLCYSFFP